MGFEPIGFVLERVYDLLKNEATILLVDEERAIKGLQKELELIESYLKDMDEIERLANHNHVLLIKVRHLRGILIEIENFLDTVTDQKQQPAPPSFFKKLKAFFSCASNPVIQKHRLVVEVTELSESLRETLGRTEGYQLPNNKVTYRTKRQTDPGIIDHEIIIGLKEDVGDLVAKFVGKEGERGANSAIVGMGGSGKTTLARQFHNHEEIKKVFPRRAWVCVSQQWNPHELLLQICAKLGIRLSDDERSIPHDKLTEFLREEGSCLVVLDDVWEREALHDFLPTLLTGNGRVLITTRKKGIVQFSGMPPFHVHNMRRLTAEQSRELFSKIVCYNGIVTVKFKEDEEEEEDSFAKLGRVMLEKCGGLPIAIITLAGLLGTKATIHQWESIKDNVISIIMECEEGPLGYEAVKKVLEFSYFDLPFHLKPCFLYLGTFKEDEKINVDTLINWWIDEGFVKSDLGSRSLKEAAKNFLEELVQRCMVQVVSRDYAGDVSKIRIHDLMRDLCIDKAKELGFYRVISPSTTSIQIEGPCSRAIVQHHQNSSAESKVLESNSRLRTLIWSSEYKYGKDLPKPLFPFEKLKQVRVLDLERVDLGDSAEHIGDMVLLRYLRLWECGFTTGKMDFLKKLRNLQTFIFLGEMELFDNMVGNMEQLRVLSLQLDGSRAQSPKISLGVDKLRNLQTLIIHADKSCKELWLPAIISTDLQKLSINEIHSQQQLDAILGYVNSNTVTRLETLALELKSGSLLEFDLQKMKLERCQHLKFLWLTGKLKKEGGSRWSFPPKLLKLGLMKTEVEEEDDMNQVIAQVAHLRELGLYEDSYKGASLTISGLSNLHRLTLSGLPSLKEWRITEGSLPQLRELYISGCHKLTRIPDEIRNIKIRRQTVVKVDINCDTCQQKILSSVGKIKGVQGLGVDLDKKTVTVLGKVNPSSILKALKKIKRNPEILTVGKVMKFQAEECESDEMFSWWLGWSRHELMK